MECLAGGKMFFLMKQRNSATQQLEEGIKKPYQTRYTRGAAFRAVSGAQKKRGNP